MCVSTCLLYYYPVILCNCNTVVNCCLCFSICACFIKICHLLSLKFLCYFAFHYLLSEGNALETVSLSYTRDHDNDRPNVLIPYTTSMHEHKQENYSLITMRKELPIPRLSIRIHNAHKQRLYSLLVSPSGQSSFAGS